MFNTIDASVLGSVFGGMGRGPGPGAPAPKPAPTAPTAPKAPTEAGNVCRDAYTGAGAVLGGALTAESGGWGAIPGTIAGGALGRAVCPD
ncbi:MAG: hypothetical protein ABI678_20560 [Kofleriaceae bacterium]